MMRYQRVSPDCLRKPTSIKAYKDDEPLRFRSGSGSANPTTETHFPHFPSTSGSPENPKPQLNGTRSDVLLQWGHNKRSRGSRAAENHRTAADESSVHPRPHLKIQRRAALAGAERMAAVAAADASAMPPPRVASRRECLPSRDSTSANHNRTVEEKSNGHPRSDKRSPPSPPEKSPAHNNGKTAAAANGFGLDPDVSKHPSDREAAGSGSGGATAATVTAAAAMRPFEWPRIYISLSRKEKEDDFLAMKGTKLPQRPKKRAKNIDKNLQYVFPGMWLSDLTRGRYEVREKRCVKKKRRGLKGMESMDSDSE